MWISMTENFGTWSRIQRAVDVSAECMVDVDHKKNKRKMHAGCKEENEK
jgi:hypothetical protein